MTDVWNQHPPIALASPGLAVVPGPGGVWVGGYGGVAWYAAEAGWTPLVSGLPLTAVTALAFGAGCLLAGGGGGIARSVDHGHSWQACSVPDGASTITAIVVSPNVAQDGTALAATLDSGVLRSTDAGRSWQSADFGLQSREILSMIWGAGEAVVAASPSGLFRSPNAGRAWRVCADTDGIGFEALAMGPDGAVLAATEDGRLVRSTDNLVSWSPVGSLPDGVQPWALLPLADGQLLLGTADHGVLRSPVGGATWAVVLATRALALAADESRVYAGTETGLSLSADGGLSWTDAPLSPLHDLRRLFVVGGHLLLGGSSSPPVRGRLDGEWTILTSASLPLVGLFVAPDDALFGSTADGLFCSRDMGTSWQEVVTGSGGCVTRMTFLSDGRGWAGVTLDAALLKTSDGGQSWERLDAPFGVLPLIALQAIAGVEDAESAVLIAATYDERQRTVATWRSDDGGACWQRGTDSYTPWPVVATCGTPPLVAFGKTITVRQPDGSWRQAAVGEAGIRRVVSDGRTLVALAVDGLWCSDDLGATWTRDDSELPVDQVADVALESGVLYALLVGGWIWSRVL